MQPVQALRRRVLPPTRARTRWMLGFHRRRVFRFEWLTLLPKPGFLPQISQTDAMGRLLTSANEVPKEARRVSAISLILPGNHPAGHRRCAVQPLASAPMTAVLTLDAGVLRRAVMTFRDLLVEHRGRINDLNVYPVPDGDTGTNMSLTLESVSTALDAAGPDAGMAEVCEAIAHGSLMGARGNSGVILSQILRGLTEVLAVAEDPSSAQVAEALDAAATAAYGAVMKPVEGTILTVLRAAAGAALSAGGQNGATVVAVIDAANEAGRVALAHTPEQLAVLKQAGVVDAGGAGLVLLFDALLVELDGRARPEPPMRRQGETGASPAHTARASGAGAATKYEVMYLLHLDDQRLAEFKNRWEPLGDSIVIVGGKGLFNCHIHTDDIGAAIEAAVELDGRPSKIRVTDLHEQVGELDWVRDADGTCDDLGAVDAHVVTAIVAVGAGEGIARIFRSLGAQAVVAGGQSMNPSTADLLEAVNRMPNDNVVILPNNKNIIPVARQIDALTGKCVAVVETRAIAEGFAALVAYDPEAGLDENVAAMTAAAGQVVAGEVTQAVRDSNSSAGSISAGDYIGVLREGIATVAPSVVDAATRLLAAIVSDDHELVTIIAGVDATPADTDAIEEWLAVNRPEVTTEVHHGGQPLYAYYFGVE